MFSYKIEANENNQWTEVHGWVLPFTDGQTLDDSLDSGKINLSFVKRSKPYAPFTRIRISVYDGKDANGTPADVLNYIVDTDTVTCRRFATAKLYDHSIDLVELTKLLEREVCDTMTVTNYLVHEYGSGLTQRIYPNKQYLHENISVKIREEGELTGNFYAPYIYDGSPIEIPVPIYCILYKMGATMSYSYAAAQIQITAPDGGVTYYPSSSSTYDPNEFYPYNYPSLTYTINQTGQYRIRIILFQNTLLNPDWYVDYDFSVSTTQTINVNDWTVTDVVNRLLSAGVTRRIGIDAQRYVFDSEQAAKYANVLAPEFAFTRGTLFEALLSVGGYIHGIPRLLDEERSDGAFTVKFDLLGQNDEYDGDIAELFEYKTWDGNEYCGALDTTVDNMQNTIDLTQGAVIEPSADTFRAVNVEQGNFKIGGGEGIVILTDRPIGRVLKLEFYYAPGDGTSRAADITPYVYENAEYQTLSGYTGDSYPYSRGWALEYTRGQKNIRGLDFVLEGLSTEIYSNTYAILNILEAVGIKDAKEEAITRFQFRVTYIPFVTARVVQKNHISRILRIMCFYITNPQIPLKMSITEKI